MSRVTWLFTDGAIDEQVIIAVENSFGVRFPDDYRECIKKITVVILSLIFMILMMMRVGQSLIVY